MEGIRKLSGWLLVAVMAASVAAQESEMAHPPGMTAREMIERGMVTLQRLEALREMRFASDAPPAERYGRWDTVIPERTGAAIGAVLGMQAVHTVLLPSGRVLFASGSSWRNRPPLQYYPTFPDPAPGTGLFDRRDDPFRLEKLAEYYQLVNNVSVYDPEANSFYRVPHPLPPPDPGDPEDPGDPDRFHPNDFFCTGHLQLPDGNPLFVGGTQYYFPYRTGARTSYIFDWRQELATDWQAVDWRQLPEPEIDALGYPWTFAGFMQRGRWYPSLVPLLDGRFVVFSGFVGFDEGYPRMYRFEINHYVEIFDPSRFTPEDPQRAWKAIDVENKPNSPFATKLEDPRGPGPCFDFEFFDDWGFDTSAKDFVAPCDCPPRCQRALLFDAFKLYPNAYLFADDEIYLTREGEWVSLRTEDTSYMRRTDFTYWMKVTGSREAPDIEFSRGPDRPELVTSYGTSFHDPNSGLITILGGQETSKGTLLPLNSDRPNHFAGGRGSRKLEAFHHVPAEPGRGHWTLDEDFLGRELQDDRTMHNAILLPTRQVLVLNGGNYDFYGPILYPLMLTPTFDERGRFAAYEKQRMNEAVEPRLYHNSALLLPDGRVMVAGGNTSRATVRTAPPPPVDPDRVGQPLPDPSLVDLDLYFFNDGQMAKQQPGQLTVPTETWVAEIFSPPYLFIDGDRRPAIESIAPRGALPASVRFESEEGGKSFHLLHSDRVYELGLSGLPAGSRAEDGSLVLIKLPSFTHGWDSGQRLIELETGPVAGNPNRLRFTTPNAQAELIPPAFYMLFYVDARGKPSVSRMVRFDDRATAP